MFLIMGTTLAIVSTMIEVLLVHGAPWIDRLYTNGLRFFRWHVRGIWFNTAFSFILSWILGAMFAADGLTVLFGAILSTGLSQVYFSCESFCRSMGWSIPGLKRNVRGKIATIQRAKDNTVQVYKDFQKPVGDLWRFFVALLKFCVFPITITRRAAVWYSNR